MFIVTFLPKFFSNNRSYFLSKRSRMQAHKKYVSPTKHFTLGKDLNAEHTFTVSKYFRAGIGGCLCIVRGSPTMAFTGGWLVLHWWMWGPSSMTGTKNIEIQIRKVSISDRPLLFGPTGVVRNQPASNRLYMVAINNIVGLINEPQLMPIIQL